MSVISNLRIYLKNSKCFSRRCWHAFHSMRTAQLLEFVTTGYLQVLNYSRKYLHTKCPSLFRMPSSWLRTRTSQFLFEFWHRHDLCVHSVRHKNSPLKECGLIRNVRTVRVEGKTLLPSLLVQNHSCGHCSCDNIHTVAFSPSFLNPPHLTANGLWLCPVQS